MLRPVFWFSINALCLSACGQILTPAAGGVDYAVQGEYLGANTTTGAPMAAQVSARGNGNFRLLLLDGGLPGAGWNGTGYRFLSGSLSGGTARFAQNGFNLAIDTTGDSLRGTNDLGQTLRLGKTLRQSPTLSQTPPPGAVVLFDGSSVAAWTNAVLDSNGYLRATVGAGATTLQAFTNFTLHLEFCTPFEPTSSGQQRGNSGIYLQSRYELQILDDLGEILKDISPADTFEPKRHCGAFWEHHAPDVNMAFPPLAWQTYDIDFTAAVFNGALKISNAVITVRHNGVLIHNNRVLVDRTLASPLLESAAPAPQFLQNHTNIVRFRNIWLVENPASSILPKRPPRTGFAAPRGWRYALRLPLPYSVLPNGRRMGYNPDHHP